jgi:hypothetical protein
MVKRTNNNQAGFGQLLETQQATLGEMRTIKELLQASRDNETVTSTESGPAFVQQKNLLDTMQTMAKTTEQLMRVQAMQQKSQEEMSKTVKDQLKGSRRYWKLQEDFEKEWRKEAKDISEMAKGMKTFKTLGEKFTEKKEGIKEKFGIENGGLKKTVLGALNVGGIFNKTLEKDKFIEQQKALGAKAMKDESSTDFKKRLGKDFEGAYAASKETKRTEAAIARQKQTAGIDDEEYLRTVSPEFEKLLNKRQENADEFGKYQRAVDIKSPTPVTRLDSAQGMNIFNKPVSATQTAAEATQTAETDAENMKVEQKQTDYLKIIAENTAFDKNQKKQKPKEEKKPEGGSLLGTALAAIGGVLSGVLGSMMSMLSKGLMAAFRALLNPGVILRALGKVFAIGMVIGALFEGIMDGFEEFSKSGSIGKALIAGLAGVIDFITFGLFDKEKIKEVIGDFSKWTYDHIVKPFVDFLGGIKDKFLEFFGFQKTTTEQHTKQATASNTTASKDFAADPKKSVQPRPQDPLKAQVWDSKYASGWNPDGSAKNATPAAAPASTTGKESFDYSYDNFITKNPTTTLTREEFHARKTSGVNPTPAAAPAGDAVSKMPAGQVANVVAAQPATGTPGQWRPAPDQGKGSAEWWKKYQEARSDGMSVKDAKAAATKAVGSSPASENKAPEKVQPAVATKSPEKVQPAVATKSPEKASPIVESKTGKLGPNWTAALKDYESSTPADNYESTYPGIKAKFRELAKNSQPRTDNMQSIQSHEQVLLTRAMGAIKDGKGKATPITAEVVKPAKSEQPTNIFNKPVDSVSNTGKSPASSGKKKSMPNWEAALKDYATGTPVDHFEMQYPGVKAKFIELANKNPPSMDLPQAIETHEEILATKALAQVKDGSARPSTAAQPIPSQAANQVESKSAENAAAKDAPVASNKTNVVNAPVTTNNNTTQVQMRPPIRNEESSNSKYAASRWAF